MGYINERRAAQVSWDLRWIDWCYSCCRVCPSVSLSLPAWAVIRFQMVCRREKPNRKPFSGDFSGFNYDAVHLPVNVPSPSLAESNHISWHPQSFSALFSDTDWHSGAVTIQDVEARLRKARPIFRAMNQLWKSKVIGRETEVHKFNCNVKAVLLYASKFWTVTQRIIERIQTFNKRWKNCKCTLARQNQQQWPETSCS